ncbi:hypothetical protein H7347_06900 [Corynebacterium sp. zg-331]|uniref:phage terminase small subunit n=1 Tax=unclassified Corynebacterium TaxID=2624378 RepID=UPI00128B4DF5|nr:MULTISPECIES: hypothetical protein [unclassified Corynebacterium]MBC3186300.1 hypothetical protein [Corynebacterium sp. zg-331]MPV52789.1 hypothetical protein [Corynebacterium sp. zg331]
MRGPVPKRSDQRVRRNVTPEVTRIAGAAQVRPPAEDRSWHIAAKRWYRSLRHSGQAIFYEPSDWAHAQLCATLLSDEMRREKPRAGMISQILSMMTDLLTTEGARRRVRVELERAGQHDDGAEVVTIAPEAIYG